MSRPTLTLATLESTTRFQWFQPLNLHDVRTKYKIRNHFQAFAFNETRLALPSYRPVDVLKRELQALHGRARKVQAEEVMTGASKLVVELNSGGTGQPPITFDEFRVITSRYAKVWRDADVLCERVSTYATSAGSVCQAIRAAGNDDILQSRLASDTKHGRIGRYRLKLSVRGVIARSASPDQMRMMASSPTSVMIPGTPSRLGSMGGGSGRSSPSGTPTRERSFNARRRGSAPEAGCYDPSSGKSTSPLV